mgnify:FL=1
MGPRITAPAIDPADKPKGPASYFPSIETTYGQPMQHWIDLTCDRLHSGERHGEVVAWLKTEHALGHGHANAIVAWTRSALES